MKRIAVVCPALLMSFGLFGGCSQRIGDEGLFMRNIRVLRLGLSAWIARSEGLGDSSIALMTQAAGLEQSTPKHSVTPGGTLPAHELLGVSCSSSSDRPMP